VNGEVHRRLQLTLPGDLLHRPRIGSAVDSGTLRCAQHYPLPYHHRADPLRLQRRFRHAVARPHQPQQKMLGADVVAVQPFGLFLRQVHNPPRPVGKPLEHAVRRPSPTSDCTGLPARSPSFS